MSRIPHGILPDIWDRMTPRMKRYQRLKAKAIDAVFVAAGCLLAIYVAYPAIKTLLH